jgi:hypothetical protein
MSDNMVSIGDKKNPNTLWIHSNKNFACLTGVGSNSGNPSLTFRMGRGSLENLEEINPNDNIASIVAQGFNGVDWSIVGGFGIGVDPSGAVTASNIPGCFRVMVKSENGKDNWLFFDNQGTLHIDRIRLNESFDSEQQRDKAIPFPRKGLIVLVDNSVTGEAVFQGYTGKKWVNLNQK